MVAGTHLHEFHNGKRKLFPPDASDPYKAAVRCDLGQTSANLFKKQSLLTIGGWDETLAAHQDTDLIFKLLLLGGPEKVLFDLSPLTIVRQRRHGQITSSDPRVLAASMLKVKLRIREALMRERSEYFRNNADYYQDMIYHTIYWLALHDLKAAMPYFQKLIGDKYRPKTRPNNQISRVHALGFRLLGFKNYVKLRKMLT